MAVTESKIRGFVVADGEKGCGSGKEMGSSHRWATTVRSLTQDCGSGDVKETVICPTPGLPAGSSGPELPSRVGPPPGLSRRLESVPRLPPGPGKHLKNFNPECLLGNMRLFSVDLSSDFNSYECQVSSDTNYNGMERNKKSEDYESGSSEELVYGPGIVKKLKKKYLSLTLRENQKRGVRPSLNNLRRATSLENILDEETKVIEPKSQMYFKKNGINGTASRNSKVSQYCARYMSINKGSDSMKRAQSMDALFRNEVKISPCTLSKSLTVETGLSNGNDVVIIDRAPQPPPKPSAKPEVAKDLPPPDVVRQKLKIFEKSPPTPTSKKPEIRIITKVKTVKVVQERPKPVVEKRRPTVKPIVLPKPKITAERVVKQIKRDLVICSSPSTPSKQNEVFVFLKSVEAPELSPITLNKCQESRIAEATNTLVESVVQSTVQSTVVQSSVVSPSVIQRSLGPIDTPKQVAAVRPVVRKTPRPPSPLVEPPVPPQAPPLTHVEIEKNHINRTQTEPPAAIDDSPKITLWDSKAWNGQNTMVFDFSNRKDIPDYIENDGLVVPSKKDKKLNGELSLDEEDFVDSSQPCHVNIIGGNIVINGKSNLRKQPKQQKLHIQFDKAAPALYEYPREDGSPVILSPNNTHAPPTGGSLCSYTPSKTVDRFELGVSRSPPIPATKSADCDSPIADPPPPWSSHEASSDILF